MREPCCIGRRNKVTAVSVRTMHQVRPSLRLKMRLCKHVYSSVIIFLSGMIAAAIRGDTESALGEMLFFVRVPQNTQGRLF